MIYSYKYFLCFYIWLGVTDWMGPELAPHVVCVVADRAGSSLAVSYELPVKEHVWKHRYGWGTAAQLDPHAWPRLKSLPASLWFLHAKNFRLKTDVLLPRSTVSANCVHVVWLSDHAGLFQEDRGQSVSADEFWMCWRWFIRALKRSAGCPSHIALPLIDQCEMTLFSLTRVLFTKSEICFSN